MPRKDAFSGGDGSALRATSKCVFASVGRNPWCIKDALVVMLMITKQLLLTHLIPCSAP